MPARPAAFPPPLPGRPASTQEAWIEDLCRHLFVSFNRADHHLKGEQYLRGLLTTPGRKSIRNIARSLDDTGAAQRLHHFICNAPWCWRAVREALADYLVERAQPRSWVVRPMLIPKTGTNSVGVHRRFVPATGQLVNGQLAYGLWYAGHGLDVPVDWRLHLPAPDTDTASASAPGGDSGGDGGGSGGDGSGDGGGLAQLLELARRAGSSTPVVWDSQLHRAETVLGALAPAGLPVMVRIPGSVALVLVDRTGRPSHRGALPAQRILASQERFGLPVRNVAPGVRALAARVTLARTGGGTTEIPDGGELLLYAQRHDDHEGHGTGDRADFWLATSAGASPADLHRLTRAAARVAGDSARVGGRTGLRDFEGRSFAGWHRHMTLASVAYAVESLTALDAARPAGDPCPPSRQRPYPYAYGYPPPRRAPRRRVGGPPLTLAR
ncbi:transposase [Streptomyces sp. NPDC007100]|uniref:transposase n=1 Tax=Streptomyces sp. NPDC007100 TaxID=3155602 RepID=UPI0034007C77